MGKDLADAFPAAREVFQQVDHALGVSLSKIMWEGTEDLLTRTDNAQPAILTHSAAVWAVVGDKLKGPVAAGAGHSLGEYSAWVCSGALTVADGAKLVRRRGELMNEAGTRRAGTMAAVMGLDAEAIGAVCREASTADEVVVAANMNDPSQTVISGDPAAVARAGELLKAAGAKRVIPLKVSGAFHSPLMAPAQQGLTVALEAVVMNDAAFPVIANATAEPVTKPMIAKQRLTDQLVSTVRWVECVKKLAEAARDNPLFIEIGPGTVLTGLAKRIAPGATYTSLGTAADVTAFLSA